MTSSRATAVPPDREADRPGVPRLSKWRQLAILTALALIAFCYVYSTLSLSPILTQLAEEFDISIGRAGLAIAAYGVPGVLLAAVAGAYSDRYGRKRFVVVGTLVLGVATLAGSFASTFGLLVGCRTIAGAGAALTAGSIMAGVADYFGPGVRGRAMGVVIGATSLATLVGVPASGIVADATNWRFAVGIVGVLAVIAAALSAICLPRSVPLTARGPGIRRLYRLVLDHPPTRSLLVVGLLAAIPWATWAAYVVVFFQTTYGLSQSAASTVALTTGVGTLAGSQLAGQLGDRIGHREVLEVVLLSSIVVIVAVTMLPVGLVVAAALNMALSGLVGARSVTHGALLTGQLPEARATVMSIFGSLTAGSAVLGAAIGGAFIDLSGFWLLGAFCAMSMAAGAGLLLLRRARIS